MKPEMDPERIRIAWHYPAMLQIREEGLSDTDIDETKRLLEQHNYIKIRILQSGTGASNKRELMELLCTKCGAKLAGFRGRVAVIYRTKEMHALE
ncbi:MAG: hypothetical protein C4K48_04890 [Candidatus Thorarchaeota archaeon]|nr:MAG: hypothetical protein C4K48_04890 [Candidatus Thorarchaeota archaeon]